MSVLRTNWLRSAGFVAIGLLAAGALATVAAVWAPWQPRPQTEGNVPAPPKLPTVELVEGKPYTIAVPADVQKALGIRDPIEVRPAQKTRPLALPGSTALDPTRLGRVRTR